MEPEVEGRLLDFRRTGARRGRGYGPFRVTSRVQ